MGSLLNRKKCSKYSTELTVRFIQFKESHHKHLGNYIYTFMKDKQPSCICSYCYTLNVAFIKSNSLQ